jgi:uncharacterized protein with HEPN domain
LLSERQRDSLQDILDNIDRISRHVLQLAAQDLAAFEGNELVSDAVERCMGRISEAALRLGEEADQIAPGPPWADVRGLGNQLRHEYHNIRLAIIWEIITDDLQPLQEACSKAIADDDASPGNSG